MTAPYRNEVETLEARKRTLEHELASIDERIRERRKLPLLDQVRVAAPCSAKWDDMIGDERKRFCLGCDKHVFNLSALEREEAERFLAEHAGGDVCVRFYQRADGTVMTSDCAVGVRKKNRKRAALAIAGAGAVTFGAFTALLERRDRDRHVMGDMQPIAVAPTEAVPTLAPPVTEPVVETMGQGTWKGGAYAPPPAATPAKPVHERLGKRVVP